MGPFVAVELISMSMSRPCPFAFAFAFAFPFLSLCIPFGSKLRLVWSGPPVRSGPVWSGLVQCPISCEVLLIGSCTISCEELRSGPISCEELLVQSGLFQFLVKS